jgi:hypothetical protein
MHKLLIRNKLLEDGDGIRHASHLDTLSGEIKRDKSPQRFPWHGLAVHALNGAVHSTQKGNEDG